MGVGEMYLNIASKEGSNARNTADVVAAQGFPLDRAPSPTPTTLIAKSHGKELAGDQTSWWNAQQASGNRLWIWPWGKNGDPPHHDHLLRALAAHGAKGHI